MAREIDRLSSLSVARAGPGMHRDGGGLYLHVNKAGARSWIFRFMLDRRAREMGLGAVETVGLAEARRRAGECRLLRLDGVDPIEVRRAARGAAKLAAAKGIKFEEAARSYIASHRGAWKNPKHADQWLRSLESHVFPVFGELAVAAIDTALVLRAVEPIWALIPETASRVRGRIETVLDWAKTRGYRDGENPARLKGHLDQVLLRSAHAKRAKREKLGKPENQPAMPYEELATFLVELRLREEVAAAALDFTILTAMRTETVIGAAKGEIDADHRVWNIPAGRPGLKRKGGFEVPLSEAAWEAVAPYAGGERRAPLFPGGTPRGGLSNMAMLTLLQKSNRMGLPHYTVHGFRSTFRDWAGDLTEFDRDLIELALTHTLSDKVEAAYRRRTGFLKRRQLMEAWARFCAMPAGAGVVALRRA